jgi:hypothetical protein
MDAKKHCENLGGHLVVIEEREENEFVWKLASAFQTSGYIHLGCSRTGDNGKWVWLDGRLVSNTFHNWINNTALGRPFNDRVSIPKIDSGGMSMNQQEDVPPKKWQVRGPSARNGFICEWENAQHTGRTGTNSSFVNTLSMKFVPVPGTEVQFCIWETRVKDYAAYAAANAGVDAKWKTPGFTQADTHPVVKVSWNDARAFCAWLTKKELAAGKLKPGQRYRLPTDAEWSVAVGLGKEVGNTPKEKHQGFKEVYPWGKKHPPSESGNYGSGLKVDKFEKTSPVGSFAANQHGIHDLGGNVYEWCEDWHGPAKQNRVLRDISWEHVSDYSSQTRSSAREFKPPDWRRSNSGFRCVLTNGPDTGEDDFSARPNSPEAAAAIEAAIRKAAGKPTGTLTEADYEKVTELNLSDNQLTSVKGLEKLTQLKELELQKNQLTDVKGLEKLTQLKYLHLYGNQLTEVPKELEKLTQLKRLHLGSNKLTDVSDLEKFTHLEELWLRNNQLTDVKGLEKLTQLKVLYLYNNQLTDVKGLEKLTQLTLLTLEVNQLTDLTGLEKLTQLRELQLYDNPALTKAQIDQLQKALPKCDVRHNTKK